MNYSFSRNLQNTTFIVPFYSSFMECIFNFFLSIIIFILNRLGVAGAVLCHVSHVTCHMSCVNCHNFFFFDKVVQFIGGGSVAWTKNTKLGVDGSLMVANDVSIPRECFDKISEFMKRNWLRAAHF